MPTSKVTRVRSDGFSNTSASEWPASGVPTSRAFVRASTRRRGGRGPRRRRREVRDREEVLHGLACRRASPTIATARSASPSSTMSGGVMRRIFSPGCEDQEAPVAARVDDRPARRSSSMPTGGLAAHLLDRRNRGRQRAQPSDQVRPHPIGALGQPVLEHRREGRHADRGRERVPAERRAVGARDQHLGARLPGDHRADRDPAGQGLRERHHVGLDAPVLVSPETPGPSHAGLDLVEHEEGADVVAQPAERRQVALRRDVDPALSWTGSTRIAAVRLSMAAPPPSRRRTART